MDDVGASWVGEMEARPETSNAQLGMFLVPVDEMYALQPITQRLVDNSKFALGAWIEGKISDKFARLEGTAFASGNGINRPTGFLTLDTDSAADITRDKNKLQYVISGSGTAITAEFPP